MVAAQVEKQLLQLIDEVDLDLDCAAILAGDRPATAKERAWISALRQRRGVKLYADLLFLLTQEQFSPRRAETLWRAIVDHKRHLSAALHRPVGVTVATLDYLTNVRQILKRPVLIRAGHMSDVAEVALRDGLTGLFDHSTFVHQLNKEIERAKRYEDPLCLALMDVDDFKQFNDRFGHLCGDQILERIAQIIEEAVRSTDVSGRYGGEEFVILMPRTEADEGLRIAERVRRGIAAEFRAGYQVTVSIGVGALPEHANDAAELLARADAAMYEVKQLGKNAVALANQSVS